MITTKDIDDFLASREVLSTNIEAFHAGKRELYRVVAGELRKLTCDGKSTLLTRIFPNISMHPIQGSFSRMPESLRKGLVLHIPSTIESDGRGGSRISSLFNLESQMIPLEDWLDQPLFNERITIRDLIRSVSDKESVHSDRRYNETLLFTKSVKLSDEDMHKQHIVAIGEYLLRMMEGAIQQYPKLFQVG